MSFTRTFEQNNWHDIEAGIYSKKDTDVNRALHKKGNRSLEDFMALISPAAAPYLEEMALLSHQLTKKRFGKTVQMYLPVYLSNYCYNICSYCGFSFDNDIERTYLSDEKILEEVSQIKEMGYDHILLVSGEANNIAGIDYFKKVLQLIRPYFSHISMEVQPMGQSDYEELIQLGLNTVYIYQETYHKENYRKYHQKGMKAIFDHRLETPDRLGKAGIYKIGLGALIGLEDWRVDSYFCALHLDYLEKAYWQTKYAISFPRLRPAEGYDNSYVSTDEKELLQLICAYRIYNENVELSLSTRESQSFRDHAVGLGITSISAGSKTNPGGYVSQDDTLEQFETGDNRSPEDICKMIKDRGYQPVWKDWDKVYG